LAGGRTEKGTKAEKGAAACVQTQFPCLLIHVLYTNKDGATDQPALLHQDSLQATGAYSQVNRLSQPLCCKSARHWLTAVPIATDNRWVWRRPSGRMAAVVFRAHACDTCWHCYRPRYPRRPVKRRGAGTQRVSDVAWRLVSPSNSLFRCLVNRGTMGVNSLPKTVTRQRRDCDLNTGPSVSESSTLTTRLPSHPGEAL